MVQINGCIHPRKAIVADFNGDGRPDIFVACHGYDATPFPGEANKVVLSQPNGTYVTSNASADVGFHHGAAAADLNGDGNCQTQSEVNTAGFAQYDFQDGDPANSVFTIPLFETANFEQCVPLKNNTQYLLVMEYTEPAGVPAGAPLFMLMTNEFKYAANRLLTSPVAAGGLGQCVPQYGEFLNAGLADDVLNNGAFNSGEVPLLRMLMEPVSSTEEPGTEPVVEATVNILPNPVNDLLRVDMDFVRTMDKVNVRVSDLTGRVVMEENFSGITTMSWSQSAAHLANGSYLVHITTPEGVRTQKFVVQH